MKYSWRMGRIFGIDILIDSSWLVIFALLSWSLASNYFPGSHLHWSFALRWTMGIVVGLFVFVSVLAHELAHSLVAIKQGETVKGITLFILGGFNLLPGFPMDGGRVFRSIVWKITGDLRKATRIASYAGDGIAYLMIFLGILQFVRGDFGGLWFVLIGWFLHNAATRGYSQVMIKSALEGLKARDLMSTDFETVPAGLPVQALVDDYILKKKEHVFLVIVGDDLKGIVCLEDVKALDRREWPGTPVSSIMTPKDKLQSVTLEADGSEILTSLATLDIRQVPVMDGEKIAGVICRSDVLRVLQVRSDLGL